MTPIYLKSDDELRKLTISGTEQERKLAATILVNRSQRGISNA